MADKSVEMQCLEKVLAAPRPRGSVAKGIYEMLNNAVLISDDEQECPDFVFTYENSIVGIEHFLVDVLITERGSNARLVNRCAQEYWKSNKRQSSRKAIKRAHHAPAVKRQLDIGKSSFTESRFMHEFQRVAAKHSSSVKRYRANLECEYDKHCLVGALIEMPCQTDGHFVLHYGSGQHEKRTLNCVPLPYNLIALMKRTLREFDFVLVLAETLLNDKMYDSKVYCFTADTLDRAIMEQRIPTCSSFTVI